MAIIGRKAQIETLRHCYNSDSSEFVAIYGRRRVGKTFLVKELFESNFSFYATGILNGSAGEQLQMWNNEISRFGGGDINPACNWMEALPIIV